MKNKFFKVLCAALAFSVIFELFAPMSVEAKSEKSASGSETVGAEQTIMQPVYVGQTNTLILITKDGVAKPSKVKWKVTGGTGKVKISKKKHTYKGVKAGTVNITATYKKKSYDFVLEVLKKKSIKAQTVKVNDISLKIPANYELIADTVFSNTKKEAGMIVNGEDLGVDVSDLSDSDWEEFDKILIGEFEAMDLSTFDLYGFGIDNSKIKREVKKLEHGVYAINFEYSVKNVGKYYYKMVSIVRGSSQKLAVFFALNEKNITSDVEYFLKNNK